MKDCKKNVALRLVRKSLVLASSQLSVSEETVLWQALGNIKPVVDARSKKVGRMSYIIPYALTEEQSTFLAIKILVESSRARREKQFQRKLANELTDSFNNKGSSIKKKNELYKLAEANKSFAFFR
jgi:small subunit ribosomal protein S7